MGNPWSQFGRRPSVHGQPKVTAGARIAAAANPLLNPLYYYDLTDTSVVFSDGAGTIPIIDNTLIERVNDKGSAGFDIIDTIGPGPTWFANGLNGLGRFTSFAAGLTAGVPPIFPVTGASFAMVLRRTGAEGQTHAGFFNWNGGGVNFQFIPGSPGGDVRLSFFGVGFQVLKVGGVNNQWFWVIATIDAVTGNFDLRLAGEVPVTGNATFDTAPTNLFLSPGPGIDGEEVWLWDFAFNNSDFAIVQAFFEAKYGGVFPIP